MPSTASCKCGVQYKLSAFMRPVICCGAEPARHDYPRGVTRMGTRGRSGSSPITRTFRDRRTDPHPSGTPSRRRSLTTLSPYLLKGPFPPHSDSPRRFSRAGWWPWELMTQPDTNRVSEEKQRGASKDKAVENPCGQIGRVAKTQRSEEVFVKALAMRRRKENRTRGRVVEFVS
jgi:hypothetical protein